MCMGVAGNKRLWGGGKRKAEGGRVGGLVLRGREWLVGIRGRHGLDGFICWIRCGCLVLWSGVEVGECDVTVNVYTTISTVCACARISRLCSVLFELEIVYYD